MATRLIILVIDVGAIVMAARPCIAPDRETERGLIDKVGSVLIAELVQLDSLNTCNCSRLSREDLVSSA